MYYYSLRELLMPPFSSHQRLGWQLSHAQDRVFSCEVWEEWS